MKKFLIMVLCLGIAFAFGACDLTSDGTGSGDKTENSGSIDNSGDSSNDGSNDSSGDNPSAVPPIINGDNEMPLVPID